MSLMFIPRTWNKTPGILNSPKHSLQKQCLLKCMLNMYKHMPCILRGSCQNPAGASSTETIWLQKRAPLFFSFQVMEVLTFYIFSSFRDQKFIKCTSISLLSLPIRFSAWLAYPRSSLSLHLKAKVFFMLQRIV